MAIDHRGQISRWNEVDPHPLRQFRVRQRVRDAYWAYSSRADRTAISTIHGGCEIFEASTGRLIASSDDPLGPFSHVALAGRASDTRVYGLVSNDDRHHLAILDAATGVQQQIANLQSIHGEQVQSMAVDSRGEDLGHMHQRQRLCADTCGRKTRVQNRCPRLEECTWFLRRWTVFALVFRRWRRLPMGLARRKGLAAIWRI